MSEQQRAIVQAVKRLELMYQNAMLQYHVHKELTQIAQLLRVTLKDQS